MNNWFNRAAVVFGAVTLESFAIRRQNCPCAGFGDKDVLAVLGRHDNCCRFVQRSDKDSNPIGPTFESERQLGPTIGTEMDIDILTTAF